MNPPKMLLIQKSTTLEIMLSMFLSFCISSEVHSLGSSPLKHYFLSVNLNIHSYISMWNKPEIISYWASKIYFSNHLQVDKLGILFSFSTNSRSFCSTQPWIYFFYGWNINIPQTNPGPENGTIFWLSWADPGSDSIAHQQKPHSLALSVMTCK